MKSILKLFLFMGIILISKHTKETEIAKANATTKTGNVKSSFINFQQQPDMLNEQEQVEKKAAEIIY